MRRELSCVCRFFVSVAMLGWAAPMSATTFLVTRTDDPVIDGCDVDGCSLREAILAANAAPGTDTVDVPAGFYVLEIAGADEDNGQTGDLDILENVAIVGAGADVTIVSAANLDRVIQIHNGVTAVAISDLSLRDGYVSGSFGGGIWNLGGTLNLTRCAVLDNVAGSSGGGYYQPVGRTLIASQSTFSDNDSLAAVGDDLANTQGTVTLTNCTVSNVDANAVPVVNSYGTMTILNSTLVNAAATPGTAVRTDWADVTLSNTVVVGDCFILGDGAFVSNGGNLESPRDTCGLDQLSDQTVVADAGLRPLGFHGGPTPTHAPLASSPVVDAALDGPCPAVDQRGVVRPVDGDGDATATCDCGAVEFELPLFADDFESGGPGGWSSVFP